MYKFSFLLIILIIGCITSASWSIDIHDWSASEKEIIRSLWIGSLPELPKDPSNAFAENPKAAELGRKLFSDIRLSSNLQISCATCHPANMNFTDNLPLSQGVGTTTRRTMPLIGVAYYSWYFWDGRADSLWAQALGPLENAVEHDVSRTQSVAVIFKHYKNDYEEIFGLLPELLVKDIPGHAMPSTDNPAALKSWVSIPYEKQEMINRIFVNMGKSIAAFVRTIVPGPSQFDKYVEALNGDRISEMKTIYTDAEARGLRLFIGDAQCIKCHSGPLFTNGSFHDVGVPQPPSLPRDRGRTDAITKVLSDEFNCLGRFSDALAKDCEKLRLINTNDNKNLRAFKTPTLRNAAERAPFMHAGQFKTLRGVLEFYKSLMIGERVPELEHGKLNDTELDQLEAFLRTLSGQPRFTE